ncbi:4'-phosphopantetheinyl transferase family protein [Streptomyces sp. NPDC058001]|uniref:4'-phosphopantetheinyl transferase family protein n=1 Tax=Streptomyces sp. NPDC058001 TaxID=3346300 RepID=UPI0036E4B58B
MAGTDEVLRHPVAGTHLLNEAERGRLARFHRETARRDFVAAHALVRLCAGWLLGVAPTEVAFAQHCPTCGGTDHGRPLLADRPDVYLSLSHTDGVVAAVAGHVPVGIDVERFVRGRGTEVMHRVLTAAELALVTAHADPDHAFLRQWVRKEALIKIGRTDLDSLDTLDLSALPLDGQGDGTPLRFEDLYVMDLMDSRRDALVSAVSTEPMRPGTALTPEWTPDRLSADRPSPTNRVPRPSRARTTGAAGPIL